MDNFQVTLSLPLQWVNQALVALSKLPLEQSFDAWNAIKSQTQVQIDAAQMGAVAPPADAPVETPAA